MSIIDRIKSLTPKQWAMIAGGGLVAGLGFDYYRRRDGSLVSRAWQKIHPSAPSRHEHHRSQQRPPMGSPPDMGAPPQFGMPMPPMVSETIVEEMPGVLYGPGPFWGHDWRGHGWPEHYGHEFGWPGFEHHDSPQHFAHPSAHPSAPSAPQHTQSTPAPPAHHR